MCSKNANAKIIKNQCNRIEIINGTRNDPCFLLSKAQSLNKS